MQSRYQATKNRLRMERNARLLHLVVCTRKRGQKVEDVLIPDCPISVRLEIALRDSGITTLGELAGYSESELLKSRILGKKALKEASNLLDAFGLTFKV